MVVMFSPLFVESSVSPPQIECYCVPNILFAASWRKNTMVVATGQGWEFALRFSERIPRFLPKNERLSNLLKKMSN